MTAGFCVHKVLDSGTTLIAAPKESLKGLVKRLKSLSQDCSNVADMPSGLFHDCLNHPSIEYTTNWKVWILGYFVQS